MKNKEEILRELYKITFNNQYEYIVEDVFVNSMAIINNLPNRLLIKLYVIYANTNGTLTFVFKEKNDSLTLEIGCTTYMFYGENIFGEYTNKKIIDNEFWYKDLIDLILLKICGI